jgi:hypothetical protein
MVYQRVSKSSSGNSQIHKKDSPSSVPAMPVQAKSDSASPQDQEMPNYTPLAANWATNNNLMRSLSGTQAIQRQEELGKEEMEPIQAKLTIGQGGDKYEQEADQTAQRVVSQINSPAPQQPTQGQSLQHEEMLQEEPRMKRNTKQLLDSPQLQLSSSDERVIQCKPIELESGEKRIFLKLNLPTAIKDALAIPVVKNLFYRWGHSNFMGDEMSFREEVERYQQNPTYEYGLEIYQKYLINDASNEINVYPQNKKDVVEVFKSPTITHDQNGITKKLFNSVIDDLDGQDSYKNFRTEMEKVIELSRQQYRDKQREQKSKLLNS